MKTTNNAMIVRSITAAAALAVVGLAPVAEAAPTAQLFKSGLLSPTPKVEKVREPVLTEIDKVTPDIATPPLAPPLLPISVVAQKFGSTLKVTGNNKANDVDVLIDDTDANRVFVYSDNNLIGSYTSHTITTININLKGGDDTYFVGLVSGESHKFTKKIDLKLGSGDDVGFVDFRGGSNSIVQGSLDVKVNAGSGDDETIAHFARKHGGKLTFKCQMASGDDTCSASMWGDITGGADVKFDLFGNGGNDNLWSWNTYDQYQGGYANIRIAGDATMNLNMDGGSGADILTPTYSGEADGDLTVHVKGRGGVDSSNGVVNLSNSGGEVDLKSQGHAGNDTLELQVTGSTPYFSAKMNGGGGVDTCITTPNVVKTLCP